MEDLFNLELKTNEKKIIHNRCRSCEFIFQHYYNPSMKYCAKLISNRTGNGFKRIKANDESCPMYVKKHPV